MIIIKTPDKRVPKFRLQVVGKPSRRFIRASSLLNALSLTLPRKELDKKLSIKVKYDNGTTNETLDSQDPQYLLYATLCFLEDYLDKSFVLDFSRKHLIGLV